MYVQMSVTAEHLLLVHVHSQQIPIDDLAATVFSRYIAHLNKSPWAYN